MINKEELRQKLYEYFKDQEILKYCFKDIKRDVQPTEENINRRQALAKAMLKENKKANGKELTTAEIEDYTKLKTKKSAKKVLTEVYENINTLETKLYNVIDTDIYDRFLKHIVFNDPLEDTAEQLRQAVQGGFCTTMYAVFRHVFRRCFYDNSGIADEQFKGSMNAIIYVGAFETFNDPAFEEYLKKVNRKHPVLYRLNEIGESEEEFLEITKLYSEINGRVEKLADEEEEQEQQAEQQPSEEETSASFSIAPRVLYYADNFTIADTDILNILTTQQFNADVTVFNKSEKKLNSLRHQDREILDYIVLTLYPNDITVFSDYQIATGLYKEKTSETVSDSMLKEINASIERIRNIRLDEGFISKEKINDLNAKVEINGNLIVLNRVKIKHKSKATYYQIMTRPFYYDYALNTGKKVEHYPKQVITRDIEDVRIEHNIKNDTLKMMLTRRVLSLEFYSKTIVNVLEIYDTLGVTDPRKYTDARNKTKAMLEDLQTDYNFKFKFRKKPNQRTVTQLIIEKYTDRPLKK